MLVFADEFDRDGLDRTKWATRYIYQNETLDHFNDEKQRYRDNNNHIFSAGVLDLVARQVGDGSYESGMIRSRQTFYYGYFEARVFLPKGRGIWPAFWLVGDYDRDGRTWHPPEVDIFEFVINGKDDTEKMLHSGPQKPASDTFNFVDNTFETRHGEMRSSAPLNEGWHVAGLVWAPTEITFFWDGRPIYSRPYRWLRKDGHLGPPAQVVLNFAVGGGWAGRYGIEDRAFPQSFKIDYVRVCQFTSSDEGKSRCGDSELTPDPTRYGYSSDIGDMQKPVLLAPDLIRGASTSDSQVLTEPNGHREIRLRLPIQFPPSYPTQNRTLQVSITDQLTGARESTVTAALHVAQDKGSNGTRTFDVVLPAPKHPGTFVIKGQIAAALQENGSQVVYNVPLTCSTGIVQPVKSLTCDLTLLKN